MKKIIVLTLFVVMAVAPSAMAVMGDELLVGGDFDSGGWVWDGGTDYHVVQSVTGNGMGGGNALTFTNSIFDYTGTWLNYRREFFAIPGGNSINPGDLVKISGWAKLSEGFDNKDPSSSPGLGVELRLKLGGSQQDTFWSNTNVGLLGLVFGWGGYTDPVTGGEAIAYEDMSTDWAPYEFTMELPDYGVDENGYTWMELSVTDRVGWRGDLASDWGGTFFLDDISVTVVPEPATMILLGLGGLSILRRRK